MPARVGRYAKLEDGFCIEPGDARTFGSALVAREFFGRWIYFTAPPLGMLLAAEVFRRRFGVQRVPCAKLHHPHNGPCIFGCGASAPVLERSA